MAELIITLSVILIITLILLQKLSLRIIYKKELLLEIDYSFFKLVLTKSEKRSAEKGKRGKSNSLPPKVVFSLLKKLLLRSEVFVDSIVLKSNSEEPSDFTVNSRNIFSLFFALSVYLSENTKKLTLSDSALTVSYDSAQAAELDVQISSRLYDILSVIFKLIVLSIKSKREKNIKRST